MKKGLLVLAMALMVSFIAAPAVMAEDIPKELINAWTAEKPMAQADVDTFMKIWPDINKAQQITDVQEQAKAFAVAYQKGGWNQIRGSFVTAKISTCMAILQNPENADLMKGTIPEPLWPNQGDMTLVQNNYEALIKLLAE